MKNLIQYFSEGVISNTLQTIGSEVETQFVSLDGSPITLETSQCIFRYLSQHGWKATQQKANLITGLTDCYGNTFNYELGRHNIEFGSFATNTNSVIDITLSNLQILYNAAEKFGAFPLFGPILQSNENLLAIPDERDAIWLQLDGKEALLPMATTSSVQFTFSASLTDAVPILNNFGRNISSFLEDYPQESIWRKYITGSKAGYKEDRYGGPLIFDSLKNYCWQLGQHDVVQGANLVPFGKVENLDIPLFLRSIWWYFRLKRYGDSLCIEVRPMPRGADEDIEKQLMKVLSFV